MLTWVVVSANASVSEFEGVNERYWPLWWRYWPLWGQIATSLSISNTDEMKRGLFLPVSSCNLSLQCLSSWRGGGATQVGARPRHRPPVPRL